jgi:hypothetical protein
MFRGGGNRGGGQRGGSRGGGGRGGHRGGGRGGGGRGGGFHQRGRDSDSNGRFQQNRGGNFRGRGASSRGGGGFRGGRGAWRGGSRDDSGGDRKRARHSYEQRGRADEDEDEQPEDDEAEADEDESGGRNTNVRGPGAAPRGFDLRDLEAEAEDDEADGPSDYQQLLQALQGKKKAASSGAAALLRKRKLEEEGREDEGEEDEEEEDGEGREEMSGEEGEDDIDGTGPEEDEDMSDEEEDGEAVPRRKRPVHADEQEGEEEEDEEEGDEEGEEEEEGEDGAEAAEEEDDEEEESEGDPIEGDDVLSSDEEEQEEEVAKPKPQPTNKQKKGRKALDLADDEAGAAEDQAELGAAADTAEAETAAELRDPDLFVCKYAHLHTLPASSLENLQQPATQFSKLFPWKKVEAGIESRPELVFVSGDAKALTRDAGAAEGGLQPSKKVSEEQPEPITTLPEQVLHPATSLSAFAAPTDAAAPATAAKTKSVKKSSSVNTGTAAPLTVLRPKLVDAWRRAVVEPARSKLVKKQRKQKGADSKESEGVEMSDEEEVQTPLTAALTPPKPDLCATSPCTGCFLCCDFHSGSQAALFSLACSYRDLIITNYDAVSAATDTRNAVALHVVNHITKARESVLRHDAKIKIMEQKEREITEDFRTKKREYNERLAALKKQAAELRKSGDSAGADKIAAKISALGAAPTAPQKPRVPEYRDQGFTRPRVLALFPTAKLAFEFTERALALLPAKQKSIMQKHARYLQEFATQAEDRCDPTKPASYKHVFDGKDNDSFRCGISIGQKAVRFYTPFHNSDLIIASPLGLRLITGSAGDNPSARDYDFLSSIEVLIIDSYEIVNGMQNAAHLHEVMQVMNTLPFKTAHTDFARIRQWNLDGHAKFYRQNIILSAYPSLDLQTFVATNCRNAEGKIQLRQAYTGVLSQVIPQVKQIFQRIPHVEKLTELADVRFEYFVSTVLPQLKTSYPDGHVLIYIPSYFDYIRVRNYAKAKHLSVVNVSEYTKNADLSRGRSAFFHGEKKFMLLTERFHFFRRYAVRGINHVVFYSLPTYEQFYVDFVNLLPGNSSATTGTVMALYSKFESMELERIIGTQRATKLIQAVNHTHMFC